MGKTGEKTGHTTYVVKAGKPISKFVGYTKEKDYLADENLNVCDCEGFTHNAHCKHLELKSWLKQFKIDEMIFFGTEIGESKPKTKEDAKEILCEVDLMLREHFKFEMLHPKGFITNPVDDTLVNCVLFDGLRKKQTPWIVGTRRGIMFIVHPVERREDADTGKVQGG